MPHAHVVMSDSRGRCSLGVWPALLYLPGPKPRPEVLFQHTDCVNRFYFVPVN